MSDIKARASIAAAPRTTLLLNDQEIAALTATADGGFFNNNKKTTIDYRTKFAHAVETGLLDPVLEMAFGTGGEVDEDGNPVPPADNGPLVKEVYRVKIKSISYPVPTTICIEAEILKNTVTAAINEVSLIDTKGITMTRARMLTSKGTDAESGLNFKWFMEF